MPSPVDLPPCVIDVEASGFGRGSFPIEVGFVRPDGRCWCSLVRPAPAWRHWDPAAESLHGIARHVLDRFGRSPEAVARQLNQDLAGLTVYSDAWGHDMPWLARLHDAADLPMHYRLESVVRLLDEDRLRALDAHRRTAHQALGIDRHRASSDARALQWALCEVLQGHRPMVSAGLQTLGLD